MKISKNSWHYRFIRSTGEIPKPGLCDYVWQLLKPIGVLIILFLIACVLMYPLGEVVLTKMSVAQIGTDWLTMIVATIIGLVIGTIVAIISAVIVVYALILKDKVCTKQNNGVMMTYIKAKKEKSCPIIEFED